MACWKIAHYFDAFPSEHLHGTGFFGGVEDEPEAEAGAEASNSPFWVAESHFLPLENPENPSIFRRFLFGALRKREVLTLVPMNPGITANNIGTLTHQLGDGPLFGDGMIAVKLDAGGFSIYPNHPESLALNEQFVAGSSFGIHFLLKVQCFFFQESPVCAAREFLLDSVYKIAPWTAGWAGSVTFMTGAASKEIDH